tara:strand:+ start:116 stop:307 length:192 start_codon:yes stop_codon:yes gene_type:complete
MATTRKKTTKLSSTTTNIPQTMGAGAVQDIVQNILRDAMRTQARELETHLNNINERLVALEKK